MNPNTPGNTPAKPTANPAQAELYLFEEKARTGINDILEGLVLLHGSNDLNANTLQRQAHVEGLIRRIAQLKADLFAEVQELENITGWTMAPGSGG